MNLQKNRSQKLSMLEKKTRTVLESASNSAQNDESLFLIFVLLFLIIEDFQIKLQLLIFSRKLGFAVLLGIRCRFQNCPCFCSSIDGY